MPVYDPADPFNWKGIAAAQAAEGYDPADPYGWKKIAAAQAAEQAAAGGYDPADPFNWKGIAAEQAAQPTPGGGTGYTPTLTDDPEYMAYLAQYDYNKTLADSDSDLRKKRNRADYDEALRSLEQQGLVGRRNLDTSLLSRGVFQSGEAGRRRDELSTGLGQNRSRADARFANNVGDIDADRIRAITNMDLERERQVVASKARIAGTQQAGAAAAGLYAPPAAPAPSAGVGGSYGYGGGGGGGATPTPKPSYAADPTRPTGSGYTPPHTTRGGYGPTRPAAPKPAMSPGAAAAAAMNRKPKPPTAFGGRYS